jgi:hypothetical protein
MVQSREPLTSFIESNCSSRTEPAVTYRTQREERATLYKRPGHGSRAGYWLGHTMCAYLCGR